MSIADPPTARHVEVAIADLTFEKSNTVSTPAVKIAADKAEHELTLHWSIHWSISAPIRPSCTTMCRFASATLRRMGLVQWTRSA